MTPPTKSKTDDFPRVFRGGTWFITTATNVRAAPRYDYAPTGRSYYLGFRLTQTGCRQQVLKVQP